VYVYHQLSTGGKVLNDLGAQWSKASVPGSNPVDDGTFLSYEQLGQLSDADIILNTSSGESGTLQKFADNPIVRALPAAKAGHIFPTTYAYPQSYGQAMQMLGLVQDILNQLS
jgi:iron complex transport system substrate-binding protein